MRVKVATFNLENLFNRYSFLDTPWNGRDYEKFVQAIGVVSIASRQGDLVSYSITEIQRNNTAQAILEITPDILAVEEVENLHTLRIFNDTYLDNYFDRMLLINGNDPRDINVGFLVKRGFPGEILNIRTHIDDGVKNRSSARNMGYLANGGIFSRDCLEIDMMLNGLIITFMINHFKAQDKTKKSVERRKLQASTVAALVENTVRDGKKPIVLGDLNMDPRHPVFRGDDSLVPLLSSPYLNDPFPADTWTHYYVPDKKTSRLDYILVDKDIPVVQTEVNYKGLTTKCQVYSGERYPTIGQEHTEASDHCPTAVTLEI